MTHRTRIRAGLSRTWLAMGLLWSASALHAQPIDEHEQHRAAAAAQVRISTHDYAVPNVVLRDSDGNPVALQAVLAPQTPVVMNFIYTTCTTICPVMTASLLQLQGRLANVAIKPRYVSISIDPDFDSSRILKTYAKRYGADWLFLTGSRVDVLRVLTSFESWRGSKSNHAAITLMRKGLTTQWTRIEGLASAKTLEDTWSELGS